MVTPPRVRCRILVAGIVQGVGFRPFVHRLAARLALTGFARNTSEGVEIDVEGAPADVEQFQQTLGAEAPPLARVTGISAKVVAVRSSTTFEILDSVPASGRSWLPPDVGVCASCCRELHDPADRRYRHPFITCTDCGPRYTIIRALPYDRATTSMAAFTMCARCQAEYATPHGRRHHAESVACRDCGPQVWLEHAGSRDRGERGDAAVAVAVRLLAAGRIVAVKGVGGFHLLCDASNDEVVRRLRARKRRSHKPFAVVVGDPGRARRLAVWPAAAAAALDSPARPIVLVDVRPDSDLAPSVAPGLRQIGVMLPQAPLHDLLLHDWIGEVDAPGGHRSAALVMTSGNRSEEPVAITDDDARARLADIADAFLMHDRVIVARCDDSVVADVGPAGVLPIRRSRGLCPAPLPLAHAGRAVLGVGGELKAAFCLALDGVAVPGPHVGDMEHAESLDAFAAGVDHFCRIFRTEPHLYVCDAHPGYLSGRWAEAAADGRLLRVQHHHAHAASLMAEHGLGVDDTLLTVCFDGTGYGTDGAIWGGEVLVAGYDDFRRVAHLAYAPLPGGDSAARHPSRLALAYLAEAGVMCDAALAAVRACTAAEQRVIADQMRSGAGVVRTSSMGRLFDVISALAGVCQHSSYEGQAAMELEALAAGDGGRSGRYRFTWATSVGGPLVIDWRPVVRQVVEDARAGVGAAAISVALHAAVAELVADLADELLPAQSVRRVGLTGGVFQNRRLTRLAAGLLSERGILVLTHRQVPPNDGGLALGQAAIGVAHLARTDRR
jgi:hydrogenase maturation protein HypF